MYRLKRLVAFSIACLLVLSPVTAQQGKKSAHVAGNDALEVGQITADNAHSWIQQGPDAVAGLGDWYISNGVVCAIISAVDHEGEFSSRGGVLTDLGFCGRDDDHLTTIQDLLDADQARAIDTYEIISKQGNGWVAIESRGRTAGVETITEYRMSLTSPQSIDISKRIKVTDEDQANFNFYAPLWLNYHSLEQFVFDSSDLSLNRGFKQQDFVSRGSSAISSAALAADTVVLLAPPEAQYPIAYGWQILSAERVAGENRLPVPRFLLADEESTVQLILTDTFYIGDGSRIGLLQLPQLGFLSLNEETELELKERIWLGQRADVASITDQMWSSAPQVRGSLSTAGNALHVFNAEGTPITFLRSRNSREFSLRLPVGEYTFRERASTGREAETMVSVAQSTTEQLIDLKPMTAVARLSLPRGEAMRLVFKGLNGTDDPDFDDRLTDYAVIDDEGEQPRAKVSQIFLAGIDSDISHVDIAVGQYRVYATKGPEYSLSSVDIKIPTRGELKLEIDIPQKEIDTPGYIAADLHVHSGYSFDNTFASSERVRSFVAEHGEVMVSSEHDVAVDYRPEVERMAVGDKISAIPAVEMTSLLPGGRNPFTGGHINFFPYPPDPLSYRRGLVNHENKRLREVLFEVKSLHPESVAQLNHARLDMTLSSDEIPENYAEIIDNGQFLDHMGVAGRPYQPRLPLDSANNRSLIEVDQDTGMRDIDVDLMEIINPGGDRHEDRIRALRLDWFSFLRQGERIAATANSDSHHANQQVAVPRNMVAVADGRVTHYEQEEFLGSLKDGNFYGTSGPMLELRLGDKRMGETFVGNGATLHLRVESAEWIPVDRLAVQINGETIVQQPIKAGEDVQIPLQFTGDAFVTVEVFGPVSEDYRAVYKWLTPYAYSNPIYVDANSDGVWQPPGL